MGKILLKKNEDREAWRHLLSAAFGLPEDGMVNLDLGRYYEKKERLRRAFSRYVQAVIKPESAPTAIEGLRRVQEKLGGERVSVVLVEKLIAGKVPAFGTATRYEPPEEGGTGHVALVEFFTNANLDVAIAGALANEGLQSHFPGEHVAFLTYHLPPPAPSPLCNQLSSRTAGIRGVRQPTVHVVDGTIGAPGMGRSSEREEVYNECRRAVLNAVKTKTDHRIEIAATVEKGVLKGTVKVVGPAVKNALVHVVLAEKAVLMPGASKIVIHRMVARAPLTSLDGVAFAPEDGAMTVPFERTLESVREANDDYLDALEFRAEAPIVRMSMDVDPGQAVVVAYLRHRPTGRILQAAQADAKVIEGDAKKEKETGKENGEEEK
jgi:hypothetical protein